MFARKKFFRFCAKKKSPALLRCAVENLTLPSIQFILHLRCVFFVFSPKNSPILSHLLHYNKLKQKLQIFEAQKYKYIFIIFSRKLPLVFVYIKFDLKKQILNIRRCRVVRNEILDSTLQKKYPFFQ